MRFMVILLMLTGCAANGATSPEAESAGPALHDRDWTLSWVQGMATMPDHPPTMRFGADGQMSGNTGCNSTGGPYTVDGDRLTFGVMMMTKRACVDPVRDALESSFTTALNATKRYRIANGELELRDESGKVLAKLK